ncbi:hypothetical protein [Siccirubricoccus sp. G192]|uniref:hypothetical protein n=1 Tax=Siccirubricoccus sp. G192 TaxID=2849651 RepID=UPI001C2B833D|nr:hypothetical protein [Siccirubricoccus sp. G192]MBV1796398.1 hypothetical protein [Siccirubricoccus sp. G192]
MQFLELRAPEQQKLPKLLGIAMGIAGDLGRRRDCSRASRTRLECQSVMEMSNAASPAISRTASTTKVCSAAMRARMLTPRHSPRRITTGRHR